MRCAGVVLFAFALCGCAAQRGYIENSATGMFLTCQNEVCNFQQNPTQQFEQQQGDDGQYRYRIFIKDVDNNWIDSGSCLDREHCHSSTSNLRMSDCNHCGAIHWQVQGSQIAEDGMRNCIQNDGNVAHCSDSHAILKWPVAPNCNVAKQTITDLKCVTTSGSGACEANWEADGEQGASSSTDCNACGAPAGSSLQCSFGFSLTTSNSISNSITSATSIQEGLSFEAGLSFIDSAKMKASFSVSGTITIGQTKTTSTQHAINGGCSASIRAGTAAKASADFLTGTMIGDFTGTLTTTFDCPWQPNKQEVVTGKLTVTQVPTEVAQGTCKLQSESCDNYLDLDSSDPSREEADRTTEGPQYE